MQTSRVSTALQSCLGHEGTARLLDLLESVRSDWSERVLNVAVEGFERRLTEEISNLQLALVRELHDGQVETFKWAFLFWIGQLTMMAGLLALMFRVTGR
jgi:hypothetical protein